MKNEVMLCNRLGQINRRLIALSEWISEHRDFVLAAKLLQIKTALRIVMTDRFLHRVEGSLVTTTDAHQRLVTINDELIQVCATLNDKMDVVAGYRLLQVTDELTRLVVDLSLA